jgi:hypothetical protein
LALRNGRAKDVEVKSHTGGRVADVKFRPSKRSDYAMLHAPDPYNDDRFYPRFSCDRKMAAARRSSRLHVHVVGQVVAAEAAVLTSQIPFGRITT